MRMRFPIALFIHWHKLLAAVGVVLSLFGCVTPSPVAPQAPIHVDGAYKTTVTLTADNTCGDVTVASLPTTINHEPGATNFTLTHANNSYQGTLQPDGSFVTAPTLLTIERTTYTLTIQGGFVITGFTALTTVEMSQPSQPQPCHYVVQMIGEKEEGQNSLP